MRGKAFHNLIARRAQTIFSDNGWQTYTEYRCRRNGVTTYFDLFAVKKDRRIACEIETTSRHIIDNVPQGPIDRRLHMGNCSNKGHTWPG